MKSLMTFLLFTCFTYGVAAQVPYDCEQNIQWIDSLVRTNNFSSVFDRWNTVKLKCPEVKHNFYKSGEKIYQNRIEMASADTRSKMISDLLAFYDYYDLKLPANTNGNIAKKAMVLYNEKLVKDAEVYNLLDKAFNNQRAGFTDADAMYTYFELYFKKYKEADTKLKPVDVLTKADLIENHIAFISANADQRTKNTYKNVIESMAALSEEVAVCENVVPYFNSLLANKKKDAIWLQNASAKLLASNCVDDPLYITVSEASYQLNPTSEAAYNVGIVAFRKGDQQQAGKYFNQSAELNSDPEQKAATYFTLASTIYSTTDKAKAKEFAQKAIAAQPNYGKAYLFLAQMYGESAADCATSAFEKKALNWLAAETALKAGVVDPKFKTGASKLAEKYNKKAPSPDEIRDENKSGQTITFGCWINETITVPRI